MPIRPYAKFTRHEVDAAERARVEGETIADYKLRPKWWAEAGVHSEAEALAIARRGFTEGERWANDTYAVTIYKVEAHVPGWPPLLHMSIKRHDREPFHDWREMQAIKNELLGPEHEAVELYPAESRKVDTANQAHLTAIAEPGLRFPFGFTTRLLSDDTGATRAKQRPGSGGSKP